MTDITTKAKINLKEGTIDLEGAESFVTKYLDEFKKKFDDKLYEAPNETTSKDTSNVRRNNKSKSPNKSKGKNIPPLPIDLKSPTPNLKDFYKEKNPTSNQEKITLFVYYINKNVNITDALPGHVVSCYKEVGERLPLNIPQLFRDISHLKSWLELGSGAGSAKTTISGDNLIEHDLPKKKKD